MGFYMSRSSTLTLSQWQSLIAQQKASGLNVAKFCNQKSLGCSTFYRYQKILKSSTQTGNSTGVKTCSKAKPAPASITAPKQPAFTPIMVNGNGIAGMHSQKSTAVVASKQAWDMELELGSGVYLRFRRN